MRKFLRSFVMLALLAAPFVTQAQSLSEYTVTTGSTTFTSIASTGTQMSFTSQDDGYATVTLPFVLPFGESVLPAGSTIACSANGFIYLGASSTSGTTGSYSSATYRAVTAIMQADAHIGRYSGESGAFYSYNAAAGTLTIEYYKLGTYSSPYGEYTFQYVFHNNGDIEFVYGTINTGTTNTRTFATYLTDGPNADRLFLTGDWNNPTVATAYATRPNSPLPESGLTYTFTRPIITCPKPFDIHLTSINPTDVDIAWTAGGDETSWQVSVNGGAAVTVNTNSYHLTGLTGNTTYTVSVVAVCAADDISNASNYTFTTPCDDLTTLPYEQDFEAAATGSSTNTAFVECMTRLNNGSQYFGYPYVGGSSYNHTTAGTKGLYWSCSTTAGTYGDYQYMVLPGVAPTVAPINTLWVKFWAKASSASYHPKFEVGVMTSPYDPNSFVKVADVNVEGTDWKEYITLLSPYTGDGKYVAIRALRPTSSWYAYVDDITLEVAPSCFPMASVSANTTVGAATITWEYFPGAPAPAGYEVNYKEAGTAGDGTTIAVNGNSTTISGLTAGTEYELNVRATCGAADNGEWYETTFTTANLPCLEVDFNNSLTRQIGEGTTTSYYIPVGNFYNYSYTQQLYLASELTGIDVITGLDFEYASASTASTAKTNVTIYLANTTASSLSSSFVPYSAGTFIPVYTGDLNCNPGWKHIEFNTPFVYDPSGNLLVVVHDNSGAYDGSSAYSFATHSATGMGRYVQNDGSAYDITTVSGGTSYNYRVNTKFYYASCLTTATCAAPVAELTSIDETEATISWIPGYNETAWDVAYRTADATEWTTAATGVTAMTYTFTGLTPATEYMFRVQHTCSDNNDFAATVSGITLCSSVDLPYSYGFGTPYAALQCWTAVYGDGAGTINPIAVGTDNDGRSVIVMSSYNTTTDYNQYLVSPEFTSTEPLKLVIGSYGYSDGDMLQVLYTTTDLSNLVAATELTAKTTYGLDTIYLPVGTKQVVLHYYGDYQYYYYIDTISIEARPQNTVTLNILNLEGTSEAWGTVDASAFTVYEGDSVFFTSTPGEYKRTAAWYTVADTTGVAPVAIDTNDFAIRVTADTTVTVLFGYGQFRIAAAPNQDRMGSVEAAPTSANNMYDYQSVVTLTAVPADGFQFKEWLNKEDRAVLFTENPLSLEALQNYDLIARFVIDTFDVNYTAIVLYDDDTFEVLPEAGTITGAENGLMFGEVASITAEPAEHYEWSHWATSADNITSLSADQTLNFRMLGDTMLFPVFTPMHYTVTIENTDDRATYTGAGEYAYGDTVTISVSNVDPNYDWMGWMENGATVTTDSSYTFVIDADRTFFGNIPGGINTIIFATNDPDMGSVRIVEVLYEDGTTVDYADSTTLTVTAAYGTRVTVEALPVIQYAQFNGWSVGTSTNLVETFTVVNDTTVVANFGFQTYNVTLNVLPDALTGTAVADPATPQYGETVTVTATAADHWVFDSWTDTTGAIVSTDNPYTTDLLFEDLELTANFVRDSHDVVALVADDTYGTTEVTDANGDVAVRFMHTAAATVAFTEGYGYTFAGWSDGTAIVSTDNPYTFEVVDEVELTATVTPIAYSVTVIVAEVGRGEATTTTPMVDYLGTADITATPNYGYVFDSWSDENGEPVELPIVVTQDTVIVAHFGLDQFTVTGAPHADCIMMGTVTPASQEIDYRATATLTATANYGYNFFRWVDAAGTVLGTDAEIEIMVEKDTAVFAMFDYEPMDINIAVNDPLFGTAATTVAAPYFFSQTITISAEPAEHYHFIEWVDDEGNTVSTDNPYTFILTEPVDYTAIFAIDTHQVTLVYDEVKVESISLEPTDAAAEVFEGNRYIYGTELIASLTPAYGFTFQGWSFDGENVVETGDITFTLTQDTTLTPIFTSEQYTVAAEVAAASTGMGTVSGTSTVDYLDYVILTATPATGHDFVNWTNANGDVASTEHVFSHQAVQDTVFYANFKAHAYTVTIASANDEQGSVAWSAPTHIETLTDQTIDLANGTTTNSFVPVYGYYADDYTRSQFIYPASMLSEINGAVINEMKFYSNSANKNWGAASFKVSITEVPNETFATTAFADVTSAIQVYQGSLSVVNNEMVINFATPYTYNGGNLLIDFGQTVRGSYSSCSFYGVSTTGASIQGYSSTSLAAITPTQRNFLPKVTFTYDIDDVVLDPVAGVTYDETDPDHIAYVDYQSSIAMVATAEYGYHFDNWSNSLDATTSTDNPMTVASIEADVDYTANFVKNQYTITAAVGGDMEGTVSGTATVDYLETVTLTATPNADHRLLRWVNANGDILGTGLSINITAERDSVITAVFGYEVYTLTANTEDFEMGGVYVQDPAAMGAPVEIFADDFESGIDNWTTEGNGTWEAGTGDYSTTTGSHSGIANALIKHSTTGNATKLISPVLDLSAYTSPELNFWFVNRSWAGDIDELNVYYRTSETAAWQSLQNYTSAHGTYTEATFTLPEPSATYQIAFEMVDAWGYGVAIDDVVISGILAGVAPSLATSYADVDYTTPVNIFATPAEHYHFVGWMNEAGDTILTNANETITVLGDSTLTALFDGDQMPMTYQVNSAIRGAVTGPATGEFNTEVTFEAIAATGYEFAKWEDGYTDNPRTVTVAGTAAENTYKAIFNFQTYDVNIAVENGELAEEIDTREIYFGTQLTVQAVANANYSNWKGWKDADGNVVSSDNPYTFIVLNDVDLTGVFDIDTFTVTLAVNDPAMGSFVEDLSGQYTYGTELTAVAQVAGADYHFVNWTDATDAEVATDLEFNFTVEGDVTYTANFGLNQYNIATNATNGTAVWAGYDYAYPNVNVTINAQDNYGDGWDDGQFSIAIKKGGLVLDTYTMADQGVSGTTIYDTYVNSFVSDEDITIEWSDNGANYYSYPEEISFSINVDGTDVYTIADASSLSNGQVLYTIPLGTPAMTEVIPEGTTPVDPHTNLTFTATPDAGYNFVNWTDAEGNIVSSANPVIIEIVSDTTLTANFSTEVYTVYAETTDPIKGTVEPASANLTVEQGALFTATPKYGYVFVNWTDKTGAELSTDAAFTLTDVTVDSIFANFNYDFFDVTVAANNATFGTVALNNDNTILTGNFPYGDTVNVSATAAAGYYFVNWTNDAGEVVSDQPSARFIVEANVIYTANFADGSEYTITAVADNPVHGQVTGAGTYMAGTTITLTAVEFPNYFFTEWNDGNTDNPRTINVTANADYVAYYDTVAFNVTVNGVTESVKYGVSYTVNAADSACRTFNGWSNGTDIVASGNQYTFVVTDDITLTATYGDAITYTAEETVAYCGAYNWNGEDRTATGDYTYTTTTAAGCDSTITLHLTVSDVMTSTDVQSSCGSFTWIDGVTYTESNNTATYTTTATNGCDSVITLNLTINNPTGTSVTAAECGSYTWTANGQTYTTSGTYNYSHADNNGCIVVDTLVLTVNQASAATVTASACGSYAWNGEVYNASGIYSDTTVNAAGCDSIVTLALTINQPVYTTVNETACNSFVWATNGQTLTESGTYTATISGGASTGCDSIITLNLTVNQGFSTTVEETACDSYNWNNTTYTESGVYTWNGTASNGCDSTVTLTLTVNQSVSTIVTETVEDNIVWNGQTYSESGTYTWSTIAANGCDSTVTLVLTVTGSQVPDTTFYTVSIETANPGMGTLTGAGVYAEGSIVTLTATPNDGYAFVAWMIGNDTVTTTPEYTFTVVSDTTVTAVFVALPVYYTVTGIANDEAMGYVLGSGRYEAGDTATLTAQANPGYDFVRWSNGHAEPTISFTVTDDITLTAIFQVRQQPTGIDESDMDDVTIYSAESTIYVRGAEGKDVNVYDINGRTISTTTNAGDMVEFRMSATGVYLVKVGNAPAKRVLVVR